VPATPAGDPRVGSASRRKFVDDEQALAIIDHVQEALAEALKASRSGFARLASQRCRFPRRGRCLRRWARRANRFATRVADTRSSNQRWLRCCARPVRPHAFDLFAVSAAGDASSGGCIVRRRDGD
jgi:hypothetical protein